MQSASKAYMKRLYTEELGFVFIYLFSLIVLVIFINIYIMLYSVALLAPTSYNFFFVYVLIICKELLLQKTIQEKLSKLKVEKQNVREEIGRLNPELEKVLLMSILLMLIGVILGILII